MLRKFHDHDQLRGIDEFQEELLRAAETAAPVASADRDASKYKLFHLTNLLSSIVIPMPRKNRLPPPLRENLIN